MKHLLFVLSALLLFTSCSDAATPDAQSSDTQIVISETDTSTEAEAKDAEDPGEDSETQDDPGETEEAEAEEEDIAGLDQKNVALLVSDQRTFGQITIKKVATARDGWVSIHKSKPDGSIQQPDSIGEARVDSGDSEDIIIDLWEAPAVGDKLWALLHIDAGERGLYEYPGKDAPVKKDGETVARSFVIQSDQAEKEESAE
ncbi:MAG: hypothetical protein DCF25_15175 [Leptolyngbya foveolarum]|uniref:DUF7282 domain-containing protein n=1 Tax=Leptolyngbya foveolarum TaxID=47253 RepID=A0A2W4VWR8_9CYAN|nr:MAG: hypothetical protein DCF25_15175 [Leptolyngbya foveolarum]